MEFYLICNDLFTCVISSNDFPVMNFFIKVFAYSNVVPLGSGMTGKHTKLSSSLAIVNQLQYIILEPNRQCSKIIPYPHLSNPITCIK